MSLTPPASWYRDPAVYERERRSVWSSEWLVFAPAAKLTSPGQYVAEQVAGYPVFVVVDFGDDPDLCPTAEAVQRSLDAGVYTKGRLSPKHEGSVGWFQRRVATAVGECP